ncbi:MAG: tubulin-like doman-containing protein [Chloroflexota bacterium]|nr:tubulin-like doman-containing protein [Chloroflexota bacterium]
MQRVGPVVQAVAPREYDQPYTIGENEMSDVKPTIYPTFVIGLGGTGTNVVRYAKRRFLRTWSDQEMDDLPAVLQVLAVDTEPLVNAPGEEQLYFHEYAYLGQYDATRLVQNRQHHGRYLDWWRWDEDDIPLGYIHNGAKQLRPLGRLSFFRKYITFKTLMVDKLSALQQQASRQEAEERGFPVAGTYPLIYIVSSLCGGTGAGMFLDVAHRVREEVGAEAKIVGIFMMPSIFDREIRSDLQRRRIRANAYAALKELNHFHTTQSFSAFYPSEQEPLPTVKYRAFNQIFLLERTNAAGRTLSSKAAAEQMAAHLIHLTAFSHLNKRILGLDVNVTEERSNGSDRYLSYSSFGVSALVMPRTALWRYFKRMTTYWVMELLLRGDQDAQEEQSIQMSYLNLRDAIKEQFLRYASSEENLQALEEDIVHKDGRWHGFVATIADTARQVLADFGLWTLRDMIERLTLDRSDGNRLTRDDLAHPKQLPFPEAPAARPIHLVEQPFLSESEIDRRLQALSDRQLFEHRQQTWEALLKALQGLGREWLQELDELERSILETREEAWNQAQETAEQIHPLHRSGDRDTNTYYDLETGAIGADHVEEYWQSTGALLYAPASEEEESPLTRWGVLLQSIHERIIPPGGAEMVVMGAAGLRQAIEQTMAEHPALTSLEQEAAEAFDLRSVLYVQHGKKHLPANHRLNQLFLRTDPFASVDGDTYPYSEAVQESIRLVGAPTEDGETDDDRGKMLRRALRGYGQFELVETGDRDRLDACHIVHGLPVGQLDTMPELHRQYKGEDFERSTLHLEKEWEELSELYEPPGGENDAQVRVHGSTTVVASPATRSQERE